MSTQPHDLTATPGTYRPSGVDPVLIAAVELLDEPTQIVVGRLLDLIGKLSDTTETLTEGIVALNRLDSLGTARTNLIEAKVDAVTAILDVGDHSKRGGGEPA
jgi:hypothetical protein